MSPRQWVYYRSRATGRRLLFSSEEIARVDRDAWWGKLYLKTGVTFRVTEVEPEAIVAEKEKPAEKAAAPYKPYLCEHCGEEFVHAPDCITRLGRHNLNTESA